MMLFMPALFNKKKWLFNSGAFDASSFSTFEVTKVTFLIWSVEKFILIVLSNVKIISDQS